MKNIFIITFLITVMHSSAFSQSGWFFQNPLPQGNTMNSLFFADYNTCWVVGKAGTILKTTNGGINWTTQISGTSYWLSSVHFTDSITGWAAGNDYNLHSGIILKTTNSGINWVNQYSSTFFYLNSIYFADNNSGWAASSGGIFQSTNGGLNWTPQFGTTYLSSVYFPDNSSNGWAAGMYGKIFQTTNGGVNWLSQVSGTGNWLYSVYFTDNNSGWTVGDSGKILKTTNGGTNWTTQVSGTNRKLYSVHFADNNTGWTVGDNGTIIKTTNSGINWLSQVSGTSKALGSVHFADNNTGWAVGDSGTILKTTTGGAIVGVQNMSTEIPSGNSLSQNYPNPFNPVTNLEFGIPDLGFVSLKIYDLLGKEVVTLVNEKLNPGTYRVEFDAGSLTSGVYFYRLTSGDFMDTKRMLLVK